MHLLLWRVSAQDDNHVIFPNHHAIEVVVHLLTRVVCRIDNFGIRSAVRQPAHEPLAGADATTLKDWIAVCGAGEDHGCLA